MESTYSSENARASVTPQENTKAAVVTVVIDVEVLVDVIVAVVVVAIVEIDREVVVVLVDIVP